VISVRQTVKVNSNFEGKNTIVQSKMMQLFKPQNASSGVVWLASYEPTRHCKLSYGIVDETNTSFRNKFLIHERSNRLENPKSFMMGTWSRCLILSMALTLGPSNSKWAIMITIVKDYNIKPWSHTYVWFGICGKFVRN